MGTKVEPQPYIIRPGDYLDRLAHAYGFEADVVWKHPKNAELAKKRKPNQLHPGDVLWFAREPKKQMSLQAGASNQYQTTVPRTSVRLVFRDHAGPIANEPCEIQGLDAASAPNQTDGSGHLLVAVPVTHREFRVAFPKRGIIYPILVGEMDPAEERSGVRKRLQNLGFYVEHARGKGQQAGYTEEDHAMWEREGLRAFQRYKGLKITGVIDEETLAALVKEHGS